MEKSPIPEPNKWLTVSEVCEMTKMTRASVYKLIANKKIPYYKPNGGKVYFDKSDVEAWLCRNRVEPINS